MTDFSALLWTSSSASVYCRSEVLGLIKINVFFVRWHKQHINMLMCAINCVSCTVTSQVNAGPSAHFHLVYGSSWSKWSRKDKHFGLLALFSLCPLTADVRHDLLTSPSHLAALRSSRGFLQNGSDRLAVVVPLHFLLRVGVGLNNILPERPGASQCGQLRTWEDCFGSNSVLVMRRFLAYTMPALFVERFKHS